MQIPTSINRFQDLLDVTAPTGSDNNKLYRWDDDNSVLEPVDVYVDDSGNVGIGTGIPGASLDVVGVVRSDTQLNVNSTATGNTTVVYLQTDPASTNSSGIGWEFGGAVIAAEIVGIRGGDITRGELAFSTKSGGSLTERMRIDENGNVGINKNSSLAAQLHVVSSAAGTVGLRVDSAATPSADIVQFTDNGTTRFSITSEGVVKLYWARNTYIDAAEENTSPHIFVSSDAAGDFSSEAGHLIIQSRVHASVYRDIIFAGGLSTADALMVIQGEGNVGIGTASPISAFHIYRDNAVVSAPTLYIEQDGTGDATTSYALTGVIAWTTGIDNNDSDKFKIGYAADLATNNAITIDTSGNVGIGTTAPTTYLEVSVSDASISTPMVRIQNTHASAYAILAVDRADTARVTATTYSTAETSDWYTGIMYNGGGVNSSFSIANGLNLSDSKLIIDSTGNVGIGTAAPSTKFEIEDGGSSVNLFKITQDDEAPFAFIVGNDTYSTTDTNGFMLLQMNDGTSRIYNAGSTRMAIDASGLVGINKLSSIGAQLHVVSSAVGTVGLLVDSAASPTANIFEIAENGTTAVSFTGLNNLSNFILESRDLTNDQRGTYVQLGRNTSASTEGPAAGGLQFIQANGNSRYVWVDASADLRIHSGAPTGSSGSPTIADTAGTVVGTQTSQLAAKDIIFEWEDPTSALQTILKTRVFDFTYKNNRYDGSRFTGIVSDYSSVFSMDNGKSFNPLSSFGYTVLSFQAQQQMIDELHTENHELRSRVEALEAHAA